MPPEVYSAGHSTAGGYHFNVDTTEKKLQFMGSYKPFDELILTELRSRLY